MPFIADLNVPYAERADIVVDGVADESAWQGAMRVTDFETFMPEYGKVPTGSTEFRATSDSEALYLYFHAQDPEPEKIRASIGRRDTRFGDDFVGLYFDPSGEAQRAFLFAVNPLGIQMDATVMLGAGENTAWDAIWQAESRRVADGYDVEVAIPWRAIRHPADLQRAGFFLFRHISRIGEKSSWPSVDPSISGLLVQEAVVGGPGALPKAAGLDLIPELAFGLDQDGPVEDGRIGVAGVHPGLTVRWTPTPSSSLLGTFNPDFSEVESDSYQIDVNRRYALYFDEKRPFFLEGAEWFANGFDNDLVYTRSMASPLYGARSTVEQGPWTAAVLHVYDLSPTPSVSEGGGWTEEDLADHDALETVLRLRRIVGKDSNVGLVLSDRSILGSDLANRLVAADTTIRMSDQWTASGAVVGSQTTFGDGRTALAPAAYAEVNWCAEVPWMGVGFGYVAPDFRAENGFITMADKVSVNTWGGFDFRPGWKFVPRMDPSPLVASAAWTTEGRLRYLSYNPQMDGNLGNGATWWIAYRHAGELYEDAWLPIRLGQLWLGGDWTRWLEVGVNANTGISPYYDPEDPKSGWSNYVGPGVTFKPITRISLDLTGGWEDFIYQDEVLYEGWVGRARLDLYASRTVWARFIGDMSTFDASRAGEALLAWEKAPGRAFYVGGRVALPSDEQPDLTWQIQAKASWVFSL